MFFLVRWFRGTYRGAWYGGLDLRPGEVERAVGDVGVVVSRNEEHSGTAALSGCERSNEGGGLGHGRFGTVGWGACGAGTARLRRWRRRGAREWVKRSKALVVQEVSLNKATDVTEVVGDRLCTWHVDLGLDPLGHGRHVLTGQDAILGFDDGAIGLDHVFASEWGGSSYARFPLAANIASSWCS